MKKLAMIILALAMTTGAFAQKMWVGGSASFSASGSASIHLAPTFGYFVTEDISVEGRLNLAFTSSTNTFGLFAIGRYWIPITGKLSYTPGLLLGFDWTSSTHSSYNDSSFDFGVQIGSFHYKVNENWMLGANFSSFTLNDIGDGSYTHFNLTSATTISVNYFF